MTIFFLQTAIFFIYYCRGTIWQIWLPPTASFTLAVRTYLSIAYAKFYLVVILMLFSKNNLKIDYFILYIIELKIENEEIKKLVNNKKE